MNKTASSPANNWLTNDAMFVALALLLSAVVVWLATDSAAAVAGYAGGVAVIGTIAFVLLRRRGEPAQAGFAAPDWTVTSAAIEQDGVPVAVTDRANRLVCANTAWEDSFGSVYAPPGLPLPDAALTALAGAVLVAPTDEVAVN